MARKKVKLVWIQNDAARRATFKKRRKGLIKKVSELSTLCDVKACALVFSPYDTAPEIWPQDNQDVMRVLGRFRSMPEMEQSKKMLNQEGFLRNRIGKLHEQLHKLNSENRETELKLLMSQCMAGGRHISDLNIDDTRDLGEKLDTELKAVQQKIESLLCTNTRSTTSAPVPMAPDPIMHHRYNVSGHTGHMDHGGMLKNEFQNFDSAMEMFRRHDGNNNNIHNNNNMFMCSPPQQLILPSIDEVPNLHSYIDGGTHLPTLYPGDNNTSWLDNFFHI
ncbi:hypothetical protein ZOSMA_16G00320 [Zostera marina]|uniref:MADS-box domain-containing protein n=1 Tax=Zostera marina TaxID=29655 RepID=A0A0K9PSM0_ZOSMR|nr:hypothetical protein ZOSMA_16G00320 [Zostera marina]